MCASVAEMARAAWEAAEEARRQKRAEDDARRAAESSALDAEMLEMVYGHDWIVNNLPGVEFVLVDRRFPQCTAVVRPVDDGEPVLLIVTEGRNYVQWAPPRNRPSREPLWLVGARQCDTLADVGCAIHDWQRQQEAEDE